MTDRMGVAWCMAVLIVAGLGAACGDDAKVPKDKVGTGDAADGGDASAAAVTDVGGGSEACDPDNLPKLPGTGLEYPDAYCDDDGCKAGACDPLGRCEPACNAWSFNGTLAFQAVTAKAGGTLGAPDAPASKDGEDVCPGKMLTPDGTDLNCCQRSDNSEAGTPALRMSSLLYTRPTYFTVVPVVNATKQAFETDLYNMVSVLSSGEDGELTVTTGSAIPNTDGSFTPIKGPFKSGDVTLNANGDWDALTDVPAKLSTKDGVRSWDFGPTPPGKDYVVIMWIDDKYDFARMELHLREVQWTVPLDESLTCAGERTIGQFGTVGSARGYVPLESAATTEVWITRDSSLNLCSAMSGAADCTLPVAKWKQ